MQKNLLRLLATARVSQTGSASGLGRKEQADRWPFPMFPARGTELIAPAYRQHREQAGRRIQRIKRMGNRGRPHEAPLYLVQGRLFDDCGAV